MTLLQLLQQRLHTALSGLMPDPAPYAAMVRPAQDARNGDYQANCAMPLAKVLKKSARDVARELVQRLPLDELLEPPEVAGPGFINLRIKPAWVAAQLQQAARDARLGVELANPPRTLVIDYSSPNVAKPMHVGHLRSTIIGDALARLHRFLGHHVITDNHLGDWGTQFGMLLYGYKHFRNEEALRQDPVREMARLYIHVRSLMRSEDEEGEGGIDPVAEAARQETAKLHAGDPENVALWKTFMPWCLEEINRIYRRLDVHFDHTHGESFYNPMLPEVVRSLEEKGIAEPGEQGAIIVRFGDKETPAIVRKRDGAFTYTTTDLATIRYRVETWHPNTVLYVVDFRQASHFKPLFATARRWGYDQVALEHISFGAMLGADRKPLQTRKGGNVELSDLLDQAVERAGQRYDENRAERVKNGLDVPDLSTQEIRNTHEIVGLGAVKYADLCQNRTTDYVFDVEKMTALDGNTAVYMQYAYARNSGIFLKGNEDRQRFRTDPPRLILEHAAERTLALQLLRFGDTLLAAAAEYKPNLITAYLYDLAKAYSSFFENCPVLTASTAELRQSRLLLSDLTARTIRQALELLGIRTLERM